MEFSKENQGDKEEKGLLSFDKEGNLTDYQTVQLYTLPEKKKRFHFKKGEFCLMKKNFFTYLLLDKDYNKVDLKVLAYLIENLDFNNRIKSFTQKDIAEYIGSTQPKVSNSLKKLVNDKIIKKDENSRDYYFTAYFIQGAGDKKIK